MATESVKKFAQMAASVEGKDVSALTGETLANYFLSNGIDYKGQSQVGLLSSGYGGAVEVSADAGIASLEVKAGVATLKQSVLVVQRGPSLLDGESIPAPVSLLCLVGRQWSGEVGIGGKVGIGAEVGASLGSGGFDPTDTHTFKDEPEDTSSSAEIFGAGASAFAGIKLAANALMEHFWGYDPAPSFYGQVPIEGFPGAAELRATLAATLDGGTRERALNREALALVNEMRSHIVQYYQSKKSQEEAKKELGVWYWSVGDNEPVKSLSTSEAVIALKTLSSEANYAIRNHIVGGKAGGNTFGARARDLLRRYEPFITKSGTPLSWLRIRSAKCQLAGSIGVDANVNAKTPVTKLELSARGQLAAADAGYHRTGILWQTQLAAGDRGAVFCTQETAITYTSLSAKALAVGVTAEASAGSFKKEGEYSAAVVGKHLNLMTYAATTLYWRQPTHTATQTTALLGSGVTYGQSFIVKNLRGAIATARLTSKPTRWIVRMAERLRVTPDMLLNFLKTTLVTEVLTDLCTSTQLTSPLKSTSEPWADRDPAWDDRAVLIEASFALKDPKAVTVTLKERVPQDVAATLDGHRGGLQSLRMRFRVGDSRKSKKSWTLGFKILGTDAALELRSLANAGAEGIVDLCTVWFNPDGTVSPLGLEAYENEGAIPPATLFCQ